MTNQPQLSAQVIHAAAKGDTKAFEHILSAYEQAIFRHVHRFLNNQADAEDVTQDVFLKVYTKLSSYDSTQTFSPWIYRIATNTVYDFLRKLQRKKEVPLFDNDDTDSETFAAPEPYYRVENHSELSRAMDRIRPGYKSILLLYYIDGFSYEEIAAILTLPLNTVKTNLRRAKAALKKELEAPT